MPEPLISERRHQLNTRDGDIDSINNAKESNTSVTRPPDNNASISMDMYGL